MTIFSTKIQMHFYSKFEYILDITYLIALAQT